MSDTDTRDRVIRLETNYGHIIDKMESMDAKLTSMHELMIEGRGYVKVGLWHGRWLQHGLTALIAFAVSQLGGFVHWPR